MSHHTHGMKMYGDIKSIRRFGFTQPGTEDRRLS